MKLTELTKSELRWKQLLKDKKAFCYIKPNRHIHDSGFRCFEVGYCTLDSKGTRVKEKLILSETSDHFWHTGDILKETPPLEFSMDILLDGYIRVFNNYKMILTWENRYDWLVSSFQLEEMEEI